MCARRLAGRREALEALPSTLFPLLLLLLRRIASLFFHEGSAERMRMLVSFEWNCVTDLNPINFPSPPWALLFSSFLFSVLGAIPRSVPAWRPGFVCSTCPN